MSRTAKVWVLTVAGLVVYAVLAWLIGRAVVPAGGNRTLLISLLWMLGATGAGAVLRYLLPPRAPRRAPDDIDTLLSAAGARLAAARPDSKSGGARSLQRMPTIVVLGTRASGKTTSIVQSAIGAELLAGAGSTSGAVTPTDTLNAWYAGGTLLVEAGQPVVEANERWARLVDRLQPDRTRAVLGRGTAAPRAALVCVSCADLVVPGAAEAADATARALRARLSELSQRLGVPVPVYVLFTKLDRVPFFSDYVQQFTEEEAREALGATFRLDARVDAGLYAEHATQQVSGALERLFESLADHRPEVLRREHDETRRSGAYEFPREFRKMSGPATRFLVELCRPSQLDVTPVLRGFYFSASREVVVADAVPAPAAARPAAPVSTVPSGATGVFERGGGSGLGALALHAADARRHPGALAPPRRERQWMFLDRFFKAVLLADTTAATVTGGGTRVAIARRVVAGSAAAAALVTAVGFSTSYFNNRRLLADARTAVAALTVLPPTTSGVPTTTVLAKLDTLRLRVQRLADDEREGVRLGMRWGLYAGTSVRDSLRTAYFRALDRQGLGATRQALVASLRSLPNEKGEVAAYGPAYQQLRTYLVTTDNPEHADTSRFVPDLARTWQGGGPAPDGEQERLLRRQLVYYADELRDGRNPYPGPSDPPAVRQGRAFLNAYDPADRIYKSVLDPVRSQFAPVSLERVSGAGAVVTANYEVPGEFTAAAWLQVQKTLKQLESFVEGDPWVLGDEVNLATNAESLKKVLRARYRSDYEGQWRAFLRSIQFASGGDAAARLQILSGNRSPLLQALSLAARHTNVDSSLKDAFQPVHVIALPDTLKLHSEASDAYLRALGELSTALKALARPVPGEAPTLRAKVSESADKARNEANALARTFVPDASRLDQTVAQLLLRPIEATGGLEQQSIATELNTAGRQLCDELQDLLRKYPLDPNGDTEASPHEVAKALQPEMLSERISNDPILARAVKRQGANYIAMPGMEVNGEFVRFLNRAASLGRTLFPDDARLSVSDIEAPPAIGTVSIAISGQDLSFPNTPGDPLRKAERAAVWSSARPVATLTIYDAKLRGKNVAVIEKYDGPWAVLRLLDQASKWEPRGGNSVRASWSIRESALPGARLAQPAFVTATIRAGDAGPTLRPKTFGPLNCFRRVAR